MTGPERRPRGQTEPKRLFQTLFEPGIMKRKLQTKAAEVKSRIRRVLNGCARSFLDRALASPVTPR
jgi:hypothetical protein